MTVTADASISRSESAVDANPRPPQSASLLNAVGSFVRWAWIPAAMWLGARIVVAVTWLSVGPYRRGAAIWDGAWYATIVSGGYGLDTPPGFPEGSSNLAFFPGYPMLARALAEATPMSTYWALHTVALLSGLAATVMFFALVRSLYGPNRAVVATAMFAFSTGSFALSMLYSEGLFLVAAIGCCWLLISERYVLAGLVGALGTATRPTGVVLIVVCVVAAVRATPGRRRRAWAAPVLASAGIGTYLAYVRSITGSWTGYFEVQQAGWGDRTTLLDGRAVELRNVLTWPSHEAKYPIAGALSILGCALVVIAVRRLVIERAHPVLITYSAAMAVLLWTSYAVGFRPRMVMVIFPVCIGLSGIITSRRTVTAFLLGSAALGIAVTAMVWTGQMIIP